MPNGEEQLLTGIVVMAVVGPVRGWSFESQIKFIMEMKQDHPPPLHAYILADEIGHLVGILAS